MNALYRIGGGLSLGLKSVKSGAVEGGGGGDYTASAVNLDGSTRLDCASLTSTDNQFCSYSFWVKSTTDFSEGGAVAIFIIDAENDAYCQNGVFPSGTADYDFRTHNSSSRIVGHSTPVLNDGDWHHVLATVDTNGANGTPERIAVLYVDDVSCIVLTSSTGTAFTLEFNGKPFTCFSDLFGGNFIGDIADLWIAPGQSLLTGTDIAEATRRKFISALGKPVDLGAAGATPTGTAPAVFFSGNAASFGTNKGTGGAFTTTGALTNASTSPSD